MEKLFNPQSIVIFGLSNRPSNLSRVILENLLRWGFKGQLFGVNPTCEDLQVVGVKMYRDLESLPMTPDLAVALIPAKYIPATVEACGKAGITRMAIPAGGFNELNEDGQKLAEETLAYAKKYGIRFVGPNGITLANTANGLCLPFVPLNKPPKGGLSIISQSGGVGLMLWTLLTDENVGLAKFASIGNKLNLTEIDFLKYFGEDPHTKIIALYLESIVDGRKLIEIAEKINKPIVIYKSNVSERGKKSAMSHTAALGNDDAIVDAAFERAGIIRIHSFPDFITISKAFDLPPMRGNRLMVMSPAGGTCVTLADQCEKLGFDFADPGQSFFESLKKFSNAGVINFTNPLDLGDIYDPMLYAHIFYSLLHSDTVDGAVYTTHYPDMPRGKDVFSAMFNMDISKEITGAIRSANKPLGMCLFGAAKTTARIKHNLTIPLFNTPGEMLVALKQQQRFHQKKAEGPFKTTPPSDVDHKKSETWIKSRSGTLGEETLEFVENYRIPTALSIFAKTEQEALDAAQKIGYPVVMKVVSPDAIHKSEAGGVFLNIYNEDEARFAFSKIQKSLLAYKKDARFDGVRIARQAPSGTDMFIGGKRDPAFGPVVLFGFGGIYVEVFRDVAIALAPSNHGEIEAKLKKLKAFEILNGARGGARGDIAAYVDAIVRFSHLIADHPEIAEMDLNPLRVLPEGNGVIALDARVQLSKR